MISVLIDERMSAGARRALELQGFYPIALPRHENLSEAISSHPDSLVFFLDGVLFAPAEYCEAAPYVFTDIRDRHPNIKIVFTSDNLSADYPRDCPMNAKPFGKRILAREKSLSCRILDFAKDNGYEIINTNQGYPACTTLALGKDFAVTSDPGVARSLTNTGINTLTIEKGGISLPPHDYGFIGGASGVFRDKIFFIGDYKLHPSADIIEDFAVRAGYSLISLEDSPLIDLGGLIFLE